MKSKQDPRIEELLNSYLDDEATADERAEVERLIGEDEGIGLRLRELRKCKTLVASLPIAESPAELVASVKRLVQEGAHARLERLQGIDRRRGARDLFTRQVLAALMMLGLVGILGAVIYRIVAPQSSGQPAVVVKAVPAVAPQAAAKKAEPAGVAAAKDGSEAFYATLQLESRDFVGVDAFIKKVLDEKGLRQQDTTGQDAAGSYAVQCSRDGLATLLTDLEPVWSKFECARLVVQADDVTGRVVIDSVRPEQIAKIADERTTAQRLRLAKEFAVLNGVERQMPGREILALEDTSRLGLPAIPKPTLTSGENREAQPVRAAGGRTSVNLTIFVSQYK